MADALTVIDMADVATPPEPLIDIELAAKVYCEKSTSAKARRHIMSMMPGNDLTTDGFYAGAQGAFIDPRYEGFVPRSLIRSYFEETSTEAKIAIIENVSDYFKAAEPGINRVTFIIPPFHEEDKDKDGEEEEVKKKNKNKDKNEDETIKYLVKCTTRNDTSTMTVYGSSQGVLSTSLNRVIELVRKVIAAIRVYAPNFQFHEEERTVLPDENLGVSLLATLRYHVYLRTGAEDLAKVSLLVDVERIRNECFREYIKRESIITSDSHDRKRRRDASDEDEEYEVEPFAATNYLPSPPTVGPEIEHLFPQDEESDSDDEDKPLCTLSPTVFGANVALPSTQIHATLSQFLGTQLSTTQALVDELRTIFHVRCLLSLGSAICEDILTRHGQDVSETMIATTRELYGAILVEQGLAYQKRLQAKGLRLGILFVALIKVSEAQMLVTFSNEHGMYFLEEAHVDWRSVSAVAEGLAPEGFKGLYTPRTCEALYESDVISSHKHWMLEAPNWEHLRVTTFELQLENGDTILTPSSQYSGTCSRCWVYVQMRSEHEDSCIGRCEGCVSSNRPCIRPAGKKTCVSCMDQPQKGCKGVSSHQREALPQNGNGMQCYKCWDIKTKIDMENHIRHCRGRCKACVDKQIPCRRAGTSANKCKNCNDKYSCKDYSHGKEKTAK